MSIASKLRKYSRKKKVNNSMFTTVAMPALSSKKKHSRIVSVLRLVERELTEAGITEADMKLLSPSEAKGIVTKIITRRRTAEQPELVKVSKEMILGHIRTKKKIAEMKEK